MPVLLLARVRFVIGFAVVALPFACGGSTNEEVSDASGSGRSRDGAAGSGGAAASSGSSGSGGSVVRDGNAATGGGSGVGARDAGGGSDSATYVPRYACSTKADCDSTFECVEIVAGGPAHCFWPPSEVTSCPVVRTYDECCATSDCERGTCYPTVSYPTGPCGGGGADVFNKCRLDACNTDGDCGAGSLCAPASVIDSVRACILAACRTNADCSAEPGGACVWAQGGCCGGVGSGWDFRAPELACAYPTDGCERDADCASGAFCVVDAGRAHCATDCH